MLMDVKGAGELKATVAKKKISQKVNRFLSDILSGKIDNIHTAEKVYLKKIKTGENLLNSSNDKNARELSYVMHTVKNAVLGALLLSELENEEQDTTDMPELETEEPAT